MIVCIPNVLTGETLARVRELLATGTFVDGKQTAGWHARLVKDNTQLAQSDVATQASAIIHDALMNSAVFRTAVRPKYLRGMLFSRYSGGQTYGSHVDDAMMSAEGGTMRSDVSMTVFLNDPGEYEGGELVIEGAGGETPYKLDAGAVITYPATTLHRVEAVTSGTREVAVSWAQSFVRAPEHREILFDLDTARRSLFQREGKSAEFDQLSKSHANLLRMWAET